jgi:type I restriction enzyme S subunit
MMLFRADPSVATPEFTWALLNSPLVRDQVASLIGGAASPHINIRDILTFIVPVPPLRLQQSFSAQMSQVWELETVQAASRQRLDDHFQSLLHRAFQGKL